MKLENDNENVNEINIQKTTAADSQYPQSEYKKSYKEEKDCFKRYLKTKPG